MIKGWTEAMQIMVEGDKWEMYIPSELAYGDSGSPPKIQGGDPLIFTMEIIKINGVKVPASRCDPAADNKGCSEQEIKYIEKQTSEHNCNWHQRHCHTDQCAGLLFCCASEGW